MAAFQIQNSRIVDEMVEEATNSETHLEKLIVMESKRKFQKKTTEIYLKNSQKIQGKLRWVSCKNVRPYDLVSEGKEDGQPLYIARAIHNGEWLPGKALVDKDGVFRAYVAYGPIEYAYADFQVKYLQNIII